MAGAWLPPASGHDSCVSCSQQDGACGQPPLQMPPIHPPCRPSGTRATPQPSAPSAMWGPTAPPSAPPTPRRLRVGGCAAGPGESQVAGCPARTPFAFLFQFTYDAQPHRTHPCCSVPAQARHQERAVHLKTGAAALAVVAAGRRRQAAALALRDRWKQRGDWFDISI